MVGFEPTTLKGIDLQSTALNHSATSPTNPVLSTGFEPISQRLWASRFAIKLREGPPFIIKINSGWQDLNLYQLYPKQPCYHYTTPSRVARLELTPMNLKSTILPIELYPRISLPPTGLEPITFRLKADCSTNWATGAVIQMQRYLLYNKTHFLISCY